MMRVAAGTWVVVLVLCALLAGTAILGPGLPGAAQRQEPPTPPPVGSCVLWQEEAKVVPCSEPHSGEVVLSWTGEVPDITLDPERYPVEFYDPAVPENYCWPTADDYLFGFGAAVEPPNEPILEQWWALPPWTIRVLPGPEPLAPGWNWSACILAVHPDLVAGNSVMTDDTMPTTPLEPTTVSLREIVTDPIAERPDLWRSCGRTAVVWADIVACTEPHGSEQVGSLHLSLTSAEAQKLLPLNSPLEASNLAAVGEQRQVDLPAATQACRTMAETYLGTPLAGHDQLDLSVSFQGFNYGSPDDPSSVDITSVYLSCDVVVTGDRELVGSLAGIGDAPLPFAP